MAKRKAHRQTSATDDLDGKELIQLGSPFFECTKLPKHYRAQKALTFSFQLRLRRGYEHFVPDGTQVEIRAGNEENHCGELKNNTTRMKDGVATFNDFRLIGKSGRGKTFILSFIIFTDPIAVVSYPDAIKVTVDGPRDPRNPKRPMELEQSSPTKNFIIDRSLPTQVVGGPSSLIVPPHRPSPQLPLPQRHVQQMPPPPLPPTAAYAAAYLNAAVLTNSLRLPRDPLMALAYFLAASRQAAAPSTAADFNNMLYMSPAAAVAASYQLQAALAEAGPRLGATANGLRPPLGTAVTAAAVAHPSLDFSSKDANNHVLANNNIRNSNNCSSTNGLIKSGGDLSTTTTNENIGDENSKTINSKIQRVRSSSHFTVDDLLYKCGERNKQVNNAHTSHSR